ncbi:MAG: rod shape-determining protein MreD [Desulfuromonas sp.]|nr:MAG: rod shape-determining protein MreD [Desulfuromonas sp.]
MLRLTVYFTLGFIFLVLQATLLPKVLPGEFRPDLLLFLVIYLALDEGEFSGALLAWVFGFLLDIFAGSTPGLYAATLLTIFVAVRVAAAHLNTESSLLILFLVACGTLFEGGMVILLSFLADIDDISMPVLQRLPLQLLLNLFSSLLLLRLIALLQSHGGPLAQIPGLRRLDSHYES